MSKLQAIDPTGKKVFQAMRELRDENERGGMGITGRTVEKIVPLIVTDVK